MTCKRRTCSEPVPEERQDAGSPFCSKRCARATKRKRTPSHRRKVAAWRRERDRLPFEQRRPFDQFELATKADSRVQVATDAVAQENARRLLTARVVAAYENPEGLIRDVGVPKNPEDLGRVFSRRPDPARAAA